MTNATAPASPALAARRSDWPARRARLADQALAARARSCRGAHFAHVMADLPGDTGLPRRAEGRSRDHRGIAHIPGPRRGPMRLVLSRRRPGWTRARRRGVRRLCAGQQGTQTTFPRPFRKEGTRPAIRWPSVSCARFKPCGSLSGPKATSVEAGSAEAAPIFLLGFARAGTSLLGQILAGHPRLAVLEEKPLLALDEFFTAPGGLARLAALSPASDRAPPSRFTVGACAAGNGAGPGSPASGRPNTLACPASAPDRQAVSRRHGHFRPARSARRGAVLLPPPVRAQPLHLRVPVTAARREIL